MPASDQHTKTLEAAEAVRLAVEGQAFLDMIQSMQTEMHGPPPMPPLTTIGRDYFTLRPLGAMR